MKAGVEFLLRLLLKNKAAQNYVLLHLLNTLEDLAEYTHTNVDNEIVAKIRQDLYNLGYLRD